jgi:hypothetical protein
MEFVALLASRKMTDYSEENIFEDWCRSSGKGCLAVMKLRGHCVVD